MVRRLLMALSAVAALLPQHGEALEVSLSPDVPVAGSVAVVVFSTLGDRCVVPAPRHIAVHVEASVLVGELEIVDFCDRGAPPQQVELPLGSIPEHIRTLEVRACSNAPPQQPRCSPILVKGVAGGGGAAPAEIPAQSPGGLAVMALAMLLLGLRLSRPTHRSGGG